MKPPETRRRFQRLAAAGILFQGGAAAVDSSTMIAALVHGLTASSYAVGAASAILRYGWLFPQIFVAFLAQRRRRRMPFYKLGAFGRAVCLLVLAVMLGVSPWLPAGQAGILFFVLWTAYAFISGIVAVPYNDIVARSIDSGRRSRLLAVRFFGGGLLALGVAAAAGRLLGTLAFPQSYAAIIALGALLLLASSLSFVSAGEPRAPRPAAVSGGFALVFFLNGALGNGITIAVIGYLMEISPDDRRPAYSGYFNALVAPAALLPLAGAAIADATALVGVFVVSAGAALLQFLTIRRQGSGAAEAAP